MPVRSGGGSIVLKLIKFIPVSHIVTLPVSRDAGAVSGNSAVTEISVVDDETNVGDATAVGDVDVLATAGVGVG